MCFVYSAFQRASVVWLVVMGLPEHFKIWGGGGVGPNFHNFNESKQLWGRNSKLLSSGLLIIKTLLEYAGSFNRGD